MTNVLAEAVKNTKTVTEQTKKQPLTPKGELKLQPSKIDKCN